MSDFADKIRPYVQDELDSAAACASRGEMDAAFVHLERAHVLGQASTREHVRVHWRMLLWGLRRRSPREVVGQLTRILGAATKTVIWVPTGNTGGANVSALRPMPVAPELAELIDRARGR